MRLTTHKNAQMLLDKTEWFLLKNEAVNNLLLGLLYLEADQTQSNHNTYMCTVEDGNGSLILTVLMNARNLILYGEGIQIAEAIDVVIEDIVKLGLEVPGVVGPTAIANLFAEKWAAQKQYTPILKMKQKIYRLDQVNPIQQSSGRLRLAEEGDLQLVADWIYGFATAIQDEHFTKEKAVEKAEKDIHEKTLYLWHDQQPVSMAKKSRPTKNGIVISLVYTPPQFRNQGYASSCVAALSQLLLHDGYKFCSLYTDLANPTSNHIYSNIGYKPIQDSVMVQFSASNHPAR